jgi:hypothetical protein
MSHRELVVGALEALDIDSSSSYCWLGQRFAVGPGENGEMVGSRGALIRALEGRLYADFYCSGGVAPPADPPDPGTASWSSSEAQALSSANCGRGSRQGGWIVQEVDDGSVVVERDGLRLWAEPDQVLPDGASSRPGDEVSVILPKELPGLPGGFYTALGDAGDGFVSDGPVDRFYWNVRPEGRVDLVAVLTRTLNGADLPFRFKVLTDPGAMRCDAGVLYTPAARRSPVVGALADMLATAPPSLRTSPPALTKRLAPGLAFAEDPGGDGSFGTHRCGLLADAVAEAHELGLSRVDDRLAVIARRFARDGLSLDHPHLNAGSDPAGDPAPIPA